MNIVKVTKVKPNMKIFGSMLFTMQKPT